MTCDRVYVPHKCAELMCTEKRMQFRTHILFQ